MPMWQEILGLGGSLGCVALSFGAMIFAGTRPEPSPWQPRDQLAEDRFQSLTGEDKRWITEQLRLGKEDA